MAKEIERKFKVEGDGWQSGVVRHRHLRQGYLATTAHVTVRVRIDGGSRATLTIKSARTGSERDEYEYEIPVADAEELLERRDGSLIEKVRHIVPAGDVTWEVDVFSGENAGLVLAEVELAAADQDVPHPVWLGAEVTDDPRYGNAALAAKPYACW